MNKERNVVNWFEIYTDDIKRAQKFYEAVLDITMIDMSSPDNPHKMVIFGEGNDNEYGINGALVQMPQMKAGGNNSIMIYFSCEDCTVEESRVEKAGGKVTIPKFSIGEYGFCSWCTDSEGNSFGLQSMK